MIKLLFFYFFIGAFAYSDKPDFFYQSCNPHNIQYTDQLADEFPSAGAFCADCALKKPEDQIFVDELDQFIFSNLAVPEQCLLAMSLRGANLFSLGRYFACNKDKHYIGPRRVCVNKKYIKMLQEAFLYMSKCFNYDAKRARELLYLINKESGGILNARSSTGARCLGQLTKGYMKDINRDIKSRERKTPMPYSDLYEEVLQRCHDLKNRAILKNMNNYTCKVTHDPYKCLFYTFYGFEKSMRMIKDRLNAPAGYMGNREFSQADKRALKLPIKRNEMLKVELLIRGRKARWLIWDDSEIHAALYPAPRGQRRRDIIVKSAEKIPLFKNEENIALMFNYWSHNGGISYADSGIKTIVKDLKESLARSCDSPRKKRLARCLLREQVLSGKGLSSRAALRWFERKVRRIQPGGAKRKKEVAYFVRRIEKASQDVFGYKGRDEFTKTMLAPYKKAVRHKKHGIELNSEEAEAFQKYVAGTCSHLDFTKD